MIFLRRLQDYSPDTQTGTLGRRCPITTFSENKFSRFSSFFRKETNKIEGSTIQPLKTGNCPQIFNVICPFAQKNIANLLFSENVMIGHSSSKCPGLSVRIVNEMLRRLFYDYRL